MQTLTVRNDGQQPVIVAGEYLEPGHSREALRHLVLQAAATHPDSLVIIDESGPELADVVDTLTDDQGNEVQVPAGDLATDVQQPHTIALPDEESEADAGTEHADSSPRKRRTRA